MIFLLLLLASSCSRNPQQEPTQAGFDLELESHLQSNDSNWEEMLDIAEVLDVIVHEDGFSIYRT
jgi:hypothetical protein